MRQFFNIVPATQLFVYIHYKLCIVTRRPKAGIVKSEWMFIARQRLSKHIPAAMNTQATIEQLPLLCNCAVDTPSQQ
jgi:hypothetical protein